MLLLMVSRFLAIQAMCFNLLNYTTFTYCKLLNNYNYIYHRLNLKYLDNRNITDINIIYFI